MNFAIVTPTIGTDKLLKCLESVKNQTHKDYCHHIFVDGKEHFTKVTKLLKKNWNPDIRVNILQENVGKGWYGHRVYAASSFLVNQDVLIYLDEDNWLEPNHLEEIDKVLTNSPTVGWAYTLRKIYRDDETFVCDDDCESLGKWPVYFNQEVFHIDTSCFAIRRDVAVSIGHAWYGQWGADRQFFGALKENFPNFIGTQKHTACYRLGGNEGSVSEKFFIGGNQIQLNKYGSEDKFPWIKNTQSVGPGITIEL